MDLSGSPPAARVLVMSRRRSTGMLFGTLVFVSVGVYWITVGFLPGWIVVAFFGYAALVAVVELIRPSTLHLDPNGFVVTRPLGHRAYRNKWSECSRFMAWSPSSSKGRTGVLYSTDSNDRLFRRAASVLLTGGDKMISAGFGRLTARQLAELMNEYRDAARGRTDGQPPHHVDDLPKQPPTPPATRLSRVLNGALFVLALAFFGGAYLAYRVDGGPTVWVPLAIAGAGFGIGYVWRD